MIRFKSVLEPQPSQGHARHIYILLVFFYQTLKTQRDSTVSAPIPFGESGGEFSKDVGRASPAARPPNQFLRRAKMLSSLGGSRTSFNAQICHTPATVF